MYYEFLTRFGQWEDDVTSSDAECTGKFDSSSTMPFALRVEMNANQRFAVLSRDTCQSDFRQLWRKAQLRSGRSSLCIAFRAE